MAGSQDANLVSVVHSKVRVEVVPKVDKVLDGSKVVNKRGFLRRTTIQKTIQTLLVVVGSALLHPVSLLDVRSMHSTVVKNQVDLLQKVFKEIREVVMHLDDLKTPIEKVITMLG